MEGDEYGTIVREIEHQMDEMRRPMLDKMVGLWRTMGFDYDRVQNERIELMINFFKGICFS